MRTEDIYDHDEMVLLEEEQAKTLERCAALESALLDLRNAAGCESPRTAYGASCLHQPTASLLPPPS